MLRAFSVPPRPPAKKAPEYEIPARVSDISAFSARRCRMAGPGVRALPLRRKHVNSGIQLADGAADGGAVDRPLRLIPWETAQRPIKGLLPGNRAQQHVPGFTVPQYSAFKAAGNIVHGLPPGRAHSTLFILPQQGGICKMRLRQNKGAAFAAPNPHRSTFSAVAKEMAQKLPYGAAAGAAAEITKAEHGAYLLCWICLAGRLHCTVWRQTKQM